MCPVESDDCGKLTSILNIEKIEAVEIVEETRNAIKNVIDV